jgi:UDP-N-acetyl-D-mannosaminuronate dehydrogenase
MDKIPFAERRHPGSRAEGVSAPPSLRSRIETKTSACVNRELLRWSDAVVILTNHRAFDYGLVAREAPLVVDTRHAIAREAQRT